MDYFVYVFALFIVVYMFIMVICGLMSLHLSND